MHPLGLYFTFYILPEHTGNIKFTNWKYMTWALFVIYADFESSLVVVHQRKNNSHRYQNHKPCASSALIWSTVSAFDKQFYLYTGENFVNQLLDQLINWEIDIVEHLKKNCKIRPLSRQQQINDDNAVLCYICRR